MSVTSPRFAIDSADSTPASPTPNYSAFPFPHQRQSSATAHRARRGSTASVSSVGSIGGSLDISARRGSTIREATQNAISTLVQPPIVRTGLVPHTQATAAAAGYKAPTSRDIPPVALTNIPHHPPETFRDYLTRVAPLFESFQRGRAEVEQPSWLKKDKESEKTDRFAEQLDRKLSRDGSISPVLSRQPSALFSPTESPIKFRRRSSGQARRNRNEPTPLSTIPNVYFDEDFHLENPRTFDVVSERAEIVRPPPGTPATEHKGTANGTALPPRKALATNAILQEKLSWYMDTVEVHLINNISTASGGFFAALGSLKELQTEAEQSVARIQSLREDLRRLDQEVAVSGLEVAAKRRRRENVRKLAKATAQVQNVVENVKKADEMVDAGAYDEAADQMDRIGRLVCGQRDAEEVEGDQELLDLRPLKALQGLDVGLQELQLRIGTGLAQHFTMILMDDIRQHVEKVPSSDTLKRWSKQRGVPPTYMESSEQLRKDLLASLKGLARAGYTAPATAAYREAVNKEMKALIRRFLPSSSDDDADSMVSTSTRGGRQLAQQEKSTILARNLRSLDVEDAEKLLVNVYTTVGEALRRVSTQTKILLDVTSSMEDATVKSPSKMSALPSLDERAENGEPTPPSSTVQDELSQALDMSSLLGQAVDTAQAQITKVLKVRNEQSIRLAKPHFLRYFALNRLFADECEAISGRGGNHLRGIINAQISGFVQVLGTAETERIAAALDSDTWNAVDFTEKDNEVFQKILAAANSDPPEWNANTTPIWESHPSPSPTNSTATPTATPAANGIETPPVANGAPAAKPQPRPANIDETKFILVASAVSLLSPVTSFLSLTSPLPSLTPQIATALLDVLRTFNSRSCQLVLGAGATRSAGLKNITTKHLALASQALSFVVALVPYMRECVRRHVPAGQAAVLAEFDKTKRLFQEHQMGIHDKLVEIMTSRSLTHTKTMLATDFAQPAPQSGVSAYMETLTKETLTLHRVLGRHLGEVDVGVIMRQIFAAYQEQWGKAFGEVEIREKTAGERLVKDAEAFETRLGKVAGFGEIGRKVVEVAKARVGGG